MKAILSIEMRIVLHTLAAIAPSYVLAVAWIRSQGWPNPMTWLTAVGLLVVAFLIVFRLRRRIEFSIGTAASIIASIRYEEFAVRIQQFQRQGAFGQLLTEINMLGEQLQKHRHGSVESTVLLSKVLEEIDIAIFGFDENERLQLWNRRAAAVLDRETVELSGISANELGLSDWLSGESPRIVDVENDGRVSRWELRRGRYREGGERRTLLYLSDLTPAFREEERQAWQRLLQVLRHELNNSLTPIQSLASSLIDISDSEDAATRKDELVEGLDIILNRARSLNRFMSSYTQVSTLPEPTLGRVCIAPMIRRIASLEPRMEIQIVDGPTIEIDADGSQLEQVLINLTRNAVESALETQGSVTVSWLVQPDAKNETIRPNSGQVAKEASPVAAESQRNCEHLEIIVDDEGRGISNRQNLFVPFYTTKPDGSGIGLVLSRRIMEAHGGTLTLANRPSGRGCRATLRLPVHIRDRTSHGRD